jgi:YhcH/YjgK/YiaL family protein
MGGICIKIVVHKRKEVCMIYSDDLSKLPLFSQRAADFLKSIDANALECGRHDIGDEDFANVVVYDPKSREDGVYEAHKEFVDIQVVLQGRELCEVASLEGQTVCQPYDAAGDAELYTNEVAGESYVLSPGRFIVLEPQDAHMPGLKVAQGDTNVKKIIFKIKL